MLAGCLSGVHRYNDGMRDGDDDTEKIMQQGFSEGFQAAFKLISELSILRGTICTQMAMRPCDPKFHETLRDINWCEANVIEKLKGSHNLDLETLLMDISLKIKNTKMLMGIGPTP